MQDADIALIKQKSIIGAVVLTARTFFLQIVAFAGTFLLTIFLTPSVFGVFYVVSAIISFLGYFSDIGLAAALVQKKDDISHEDLVTTFTIQQVLVGFLVVVSLVASPGIASFYRLDAAGLWLLRALIVSFFLSSLKTIPSVLLERNLEFQKLVIPTIVETVAFYIVAVVLAWRSFGITSFSWAVFVRGVAGLVTIYLVAPWKVRLGYSRSSVRKLLRFGIPFQLNSFLALVKDDLLTIYLGKMLPFAHVGYIGWAKKWAEVPLRLFMDGVIRVTFPAFSRLQHDRALLGRALEKTLFGLAATILPVLVGLIFFIDPLVALIPRYTKWEPAITSFYLFVIATGVAGFSTPLVNALNAVGRIKITLALMILWTASTWVLTVWLVGLYGFNGYALALSCISITLILVVYLVKKISPFRFWKSVAIPCSISLIQALWYVFFRGGAPYDSLRIVFVATSGVILYTGLLWLVDHGRIKSLLPKKQ